MPTLGDLAGFMGFAPKPGTSALSSQESYGSGWGTSNGLTQEQANNLLATIKQYDPNAKVTMTPGESYSNESGTGTRPDTYSVDYDSSKLPALSQQAQQMYQQYGGNIGNASLGPDGKLSVDKGYTLHDPTAYITDPNYGVISPQANFTQNLNGQDKIAQIMKTLVLSGVTGGMGAGLGAALGGGLGGSLAGGALKSGIGMLSGGSFNPLSLVSSALPGFNIPGLDQILPYLNLAQGAYGASKGNVGAGVNTIGQLAKMGGFQLPTG